MILGTMSNGKIPVEWFGAVGGKGVSTNYTKDGKTYSTYKNQYTQ